MSMSIGTGGPWGKHGRPQEFLQEGAKYIAPPFPLHPFPCLHSSFTCTCTFSRGGQVPPCPCLRATVRKGHKTVNFEDQEVKGQGHSRLKIDLEA